MLNQELIHYIETQIVSRYNAFDKAHHTDHVRMVIDRSMDLATHYPVDQEMVYVIAAYHDTGLEVEREQHHIISGELLMADQQLRIWFTEEQLNTMRNAVEDHRASLDHEPRTIYGRIVAEADRMIDTTTIIRRTIQYGLAHYPTLDIEEHYIRLKEHLQHKYADGGYLKLWIPESDNAQRLDELRKTIINELELRNLFNHIFETEQQ